MIIILNSVEKISSELKEKGEVMPASYDCIFKAVMVDCPKYLADFISRVTNIKKELILKTYVIRNTEYIISNALERRKTSDFIISLCKHIIINIEFNRSYYDGIIERNEAYIGKIKGELLNKGEKYTSNYKAIKININNFQHFDSDKVMFIFKLRDNKGLVETESSVK